MHTETARNLIITQDNAKIDDSEHCSRAELLATHVKRLETLHSTSWVCVQCVHPFLVCYMVRMIRPCNRQWHRLKMSVDVEYIPSCCIEKMHLHAAIFDLPVETELVNEPTSAENFSRFLNLHVHVLS